MKTRVIFLLSLFTIATQLFAQNISGVVKNTNGDPLQGASIILENLQDSTKIAAVLANQTGAFSIPVASGKDYSLLVSYIGYQQTRINCKAGDNVDVRMQEEATNIAAAVAVASKITPEADGYTIRLKSSELTKGKQAAEALAFLPGVTEEGGTYKINGMPVSEISVDGVKLPSLDELKNLPAEMIDKAKVTYLAAASQNAASAGGTISLTLRQPPKGGFYGSLRAGTTLYPDYGFSNEQAGGVIYGRWKNFSIYDNLSFDFKQPEEKATQTIWNFANEQSTQIDEKIKYQGRAIRNRLSLTQQIGQKTTLGASYYIAGNRMKTTSRTTPEGITDETVVANRNNFTEHEATLKAASAIKRTSVEITADYFNRQTTAKADYSYADATSEKSEDNTSLNMYKISADLTTPRSQKAVLKYGASVQYLTSEFKPETTLCTATDRFRTSQTPVRTSGLTPLAYFSLQGQTRKLMYSAGVNFQLNRIEYKTLATGEKSTSNQWGISPVLQLMMPVGKSNKHFLMLNYKRTLDDIPYAAISSSIAWEDSYNYTVGNPDLKSPVSDMLMFGASLLRNTLNLSLLYGHTKDNIYWETQQDPATANVFYTTPINLSSQNFGGFGVEINCKPAKPWTMKLSGRLEFHPEDNTIGGVHYGKTSFRQYYAMYNTFTFNHGWGGMLNLLLEPTYKTYDRTYHTVYNAGGNIYKNLCNNKLQLRLTFNLFGNRRKYDRTTPSSRITFNNRTSVQNVGLSLTWNFSGGKKTSVQAIETATQAYQEIRDAK